MAQLVLSGGVMALPDIPVFSNVKFVDENRNLTAEAALFNDELNQTLLAISNLISLISNGRVINDGSVNRGTIVNDALYAPDKTSAEIVSLGADASIKVGAIFFDTDAAKLKVKVGAGVIETISSS